MDEEELPPISEATACELYGHVFEEVDGAPNWRRCTDCGEEYIDD